MTTFSTATGQNQALYVGYFGRAGDPAGISYWGGQIASGALTAAGVAASYSVQPESTAKYPYLAAPSTNSPTTFINQIYQNLFNHAADAGGLAFWTDQLTKAAGNPSAIGTFILDVMSGATGTDNTALLNKVDVGSYFTDQVTANAAAWSAYLQDASLGEVTAVGSSAASVTSAKAVTDAIVGVQVGVGKSVQGTSGNDVLVGGIANDDLHGQGGNDLLIGGLGPDVLDGGAGTDAASYRYATQGITASLANPAANTGEAVGDTYIAIESLAGSAFADRLTGDSGSNILFGNGGADVLDGGAGFDYASYAFAAIGVTASLANPSLNTGDAAGDTYISIESLVGSALDDVLSGNAQDTILRGNGGADTLIGGGAVGRLYTASYGESPIGVTVSLANPTINTGEAVGDTFIGINGLSGSFFNDVLIGDAGQNSLQGNPGADVLDGGAGLDYAGYSASTTGLTVSLATPSLNTGEAAGDTYISIERLAGSVFADTLIGDAGNNTLAGNLGNDVLTGGAGSDLFLFNTALGAGNVDTITDFTVGTDFVQLNQSVFPKTGIVVPFGTSTLSSSFFYVGAAANDGDDYIIYNPTNGNLIYDSDGTGAQAGTVFAVLPVGLALTQDSIVVSDTFVFA